MTSFSRIPNDIIDNAKLNPYQFQVFSIIVRKTDGWCKTTDGISLSQFLKLVTFKKPKLISTLKELEKLGLIDIVHTVSKSGGKSYNLYSVDSKIVSKYNDRVVTEGYHPSNSELPPLVTEDYIQKKLITKETNTKQLESDFERVWKYYTEELKAKGNSAGSKKNALKNYKDLITKKKVTHRDISSAVQLEANKQYGVRHLERVLKVDEVKELLRAFRDGEIEYKHKSNIEHKGDKLLRGINTGTKRDF